MCTFSANFAFDTATYEQTNRYKTRDVVNTYLNVTFEIYFQTLPPSQRLSLEINMVIIFVLQRPVMCIVIICVVEACHVHSYIYNLRVAEVCHVHAVRFGSAQFHLYT